MELTESVFARRFRYFLPILLFSCSTTLWASQVSLQWDANTEPDVVGYRVHYGAEAGSYPDSIDVGNATTATVSVPVSYSTCFFVVTAVNEAGLESGFSNEVSAMPKFVTVPPAGLSAVAGESVVNLDWSTNTDAGVGGYRVYRSLASGGGFAAIANNVSQSEFVDTTVSNGTTYYYVVTAGYTTGQESAFSNEALGRPEDRTSPIVNLTTSSPTVTGEFTVGVAFSEPVTGLDLSDFVLGNGTCQALNGASAGYSITVSPASPGMVTISLSAGAANDAAGNASLASNSLAVSFEDSSESSKASFAIAEETRKGTKSGSLANLAESDNVYESLTEVPSGSKASRSFSQLEHRWTFEVSGGMTVLYVEAHHSVSRDGDDFIFAYSKDGINFTNVITVSKISDDGVAQTASLGALEGRVYIRVLDTNRRLGTSTALDTLFVDQLLIETSSGGSVHVKDIAMRFSRDRRGRYTGIATVTVSDESGAPVPGATVSASWSGVTSGPGRAITDQNGVVEFKSSRVNGGGVFKITIDGIAAPGFTYEPALNVETSDSITAP